MSVEEVIYDVLSNDVNVTNIFGSNIFPLSAKKSKLPALMYRIFITDTNETKLTPSLKDFYILRLHIFSEDYMDVINAVKHLRNLLDFKEFSDDEDNVVIDLIKFESFTDEYEEKPELFNRVMDFSMHIFN
ncbi:hypothetical protein J2X69_003046 [Algoriphagus sp. 4150]|uniref:hypothetical protein n=1 Tax=Algoriphagus sp. 4150 TaxID=2817756 RepID=UPI00285C7827|nr:hypothetical protein [Algoriphagus sp. 4150]MDR7130689.1 hypothetical protein [Algoriphagus sp. 4150]